MVGDEVTAVVNWPDMGPDFSEEVDAVLESDLETPREAIQKVLDNEYDQGGVILEIQNTVPDWTF